MFILVKPCLLTYATDKPTFPKFNVFFAFGESGDPPTEKRPCDDHDDDDDLPLFMAVQLLSNFW